MMAVFNGSLQLGHSSIISQNLLRYCFFEVFYTLIQIQVDGCSSSQIRQARPDNTDVPLIIEGGKQFTNTLDRIEGALVFGAESRVLAP